MRMGVINSNYNSNLHSNILPNHSPNSNTIHNLHNPNATHTKKVIFDSTLIKRVAVAAVPVLCLHIPFRAPLSIAMGTLRIWNVNDKDLFSTIISIAALAGTIFHHKVGLVIAMIQNIVLEINKLLKAENWKERSVGLMKILNFLLILAIAFHKGLELSIIAYAIQIVVSLIQSREEYKKGRWIESVSNLLVAMIRLYQNQMKIQQLVKR